MSTLRTLKGVSPDVLRLNPHFASKAHARRGKGNGRTVSHQARYRHTRYALASHLTRGVLCPDCGATGGGRTEHMPVKAYRLVIYLRCLACGWRMKVGGEEA